MAESVTTSQAAGPGYTWAGRGASLTWANQGATLTWAAHDGNWTCDVASTLAVAEQSTLATTLNKAETLNLAEAGKRDITQQIAEAVTLLESAGNLATFVRTFAETLGVLEAAGNDIGINKVDAFALAEAVGRDCGKNVSETLNLAEVNSRIATFVRQLVENIALAESAGKAISIYQTEAPLQVTDTLRQAARAVISDMLIGATDISANDFAAMLAQANPLGYEPFKAFLEGDHEYQDAIFKATIQSTDISSGRLLGTALTVDVPDLFDGGTASVTAGGVFVPFTLAFNAPPEVNTVLKGGASFAVPRVSNITKTGFTLELLNASSTSVSGTVSWKAHGY